MKTKTMAYGFTTLLFGSLLVALAPTAAAQVNIVVTGENADSKVTGRLAPETGSGEIDYTFTVSVPQTGPNAAPVACPTSTVTIKFDVTDSPPYATVTLSPALKTVVLTAQDTTEPVTTTLTIVTSRQAIAFKSDVYEVTATAQSGTTQQGCTVQGGGNDLLQSTIINDYLPIMEYTPAKYIHKTGQNKDVLFPIKVTNFGNGQTRVTTTTEQPNKNKLDAVLAPSVTTLNTGLESKTDVTKDIVVTARTPHNNGYSNQLYSFIVKFSATAVQPGEGIAKDDQQVSLSVQVQGVYVPGFDPTMALAALGIGLVMLGAARRRLG